VGGEKYPGSTPSTGRGGEIKQTGERVSGKGGGKNEVDAGKKRNRSEQLQITHWRGNTLLTLGIPGGTSGNSLLLGKGGTFTTVV